MAYPSNLQAFSSEGRYLNDEINEYTTISHSPSFNPADFDFGMIHSRQSAVGHPRIIPATMISSINSAVGPNGLGFNNTESTCLPSVFSSQYSHAPPLPILPTAQMREMYPLFSPYRAMSFPASGAYDHLASQPQGLFDALDDPATTTGDDSIPEDDLDTEPYAKLIFRALKSAPKHQMVLQDIYEWFEKNTSKAKDASSKGWQNSIRHNLSMNGDFRKVERPSTHDDGKKGFIWVLEPKALRKGGVDSTTRYRKSTSGKKSNRSEGVTIKRRRSGGKSIKLFKPQAKPTEASGHRVTLPRCDDNMDAVQNVHLTAQPYSQSRSIDGIDMDMANYDDFYNMSDRIYRMDTPSMTPQSSLPEMSPYSFDDIVGISNEIGHEPLFYETSDTDVVRSCLLTGRPLCDSDTHATGCEFGF